MRRAWLVLVVLLIVGGLAFAQEQQYKKPTAAVCFELGGGVLAPLGVGAEFFLGPIGLGVEVRGMFLFLGGEGIGTLEPGATVRFYFGDLDSCLYLMGGASYVTGWAFGGGSGGTADFGLFKPKAAIGYNALFGRDNRVRFGVELGGVYMWPVLAGEVVETGELFPILPHLLLMFGRAF